MAAKIYVPKFIDNDVRAWIGIADLALAQIANGRDRYTRFLSEIPPKILENLTDITNGHLQAHADAVAAAAAAIAAGQPAPAAYDWVAAYNALKTSLKERYSPDDRAAIRKLLLNEKMGSQKPTEYLRGLQRIIHDRPVQCGDIVREIFLAGLPGTIQFQLVAQAHLAIDDLGKMADKLWDVTQQQHGGSRAINAVTRSASPTPSTSSTTDPALLKIIGQMTEQMAALTAKITELDTRDHERGRSRGRDEGVRGRGRSRSSSGARGGKPFQKATPEMCFYHVNFGVKAHKCQHTSNGGVCRHAASTAPAQPAPIAATNNVSVPNDVMDRLVAELAAFNANNTAAGNAQ
jgi:hypothetical protein